MTYMVEFIPMETKISKVCRPKWLCSIENSEQDQLRVISIVSLLTRYCVLAAKGSYTGEGRTPSL